MARRIQQYSNSQITVTFDPNLCIHAARCLWGLPEVFDVGRRKWIEPDAAQPGEIANTIERCPSGALQYEFADGTLELPDREPVARAQRDGPLYVRGEITIVDAEGGEIANGTRFALCRCGQSANKPFCDNSHRDAGFRAE